MIRVVKQLCINSPSILEGELWENLSFATASYITSFHVPRSTSPAPQASVPRSTSPAPQALLITYLPYALRYSVGVRLVYCLKIFEK